MTAHQIKAKVISKEKLSEDIVRLSFDAPDIAAQACPGQFMMVRTTSQLDPLLRRPFSIHQVTTGGLVQILLKVVGKGSGFLAEMEKGDCLDLVGPLGHGYATTVDPNARICIVGGGMGCAPLYFLTRTLLRERRFAKLEVYLGATEAKELSGVREGFENLGVKVFSATDDGSLGYRGYVTDLVAGSLDRGAGGWRFYTCGPYPMMQKVAELCAAENWPCQVSLETMMACGISACLGCTVPCSESRARSTSQPYMHVCKDGPVFESGDVLWTRGSR